MKHRKLFVVGAVKDSQPQLEMKNRLAQSFAILLLLGGVGFLVWRFGGVSGRSSYQGVVTVNVTGGTGSSFSGLYIADGHRVEFTNSVPWSIAATNLSLYEVRKSDPATKLILDLRGPELQMNATIREGELGVRAKWDDGWSYEAIR
jgi:hypothetical protein